MIAFNDKFHLHKDVRCSDKSLTHRALMIAAIADGTSVLHNVTLSRDVLATVESLRRLGAEISVDGSDVVVTPGALPKEQITLDCGGSGTTARLLAGLCVGLGVDAVFVGDESLSKRPMERVIAPLNELGADIFSAPDCLFVTRKSSLVGRQMTSCVHSAQVKSAVVLAALFADGETRYTEQIPTRNHTEVLLQQLGADVQVCGNTVIVHKSRPRRFETTLPNDPSAAAYSVALALLSRQKARFVNVLLNERRLGFFRVLQRAGADIRFCNVRTVLGEQVGDIEVYPSKIAPLSATNVDVCDGVDEVPLLAAVAMFVEGVHTFDEIGELAHKECDRIAAIKHMAEVCNRQFECKNNRITIVSKGILPKNKWFCSFGDHRIAMCEAVISVSSGCGAVDCAPFDVSHLHFLDALGICPLRFALVGGNVGDSPSPKLHAFLAMNSGVCCTYECVSLPQTTPQTLMRLIGSFDGANVTMPFKVTVAQSLKAECPVNTVLKGTQALSTDGYGVVQALRDHRIRFENQPLWIVGAGGAAQSAVKELLKYGCKLHVINRTRAHAAEISKKYALPRRIADPVGVLSFVPHCAMEEQLVLPPSCRFVFVADYHGESKLAEQARNRDIEVIDGTEMLFHQGAMSFSLWTGTPVQTDCRAFLQFLQQSKEVTK